MGQVKYDDKLWLLISNETEQTLPFFFGFFSPEVQKAFQKIRLIITERVQVFVKDGCTKILYDGKELDPPMLFYPAYTNSDAFLLEQILLRFGCKSIVNFDETRIARSKLLVHQRLAEASIPMPKTMLVFSAGDKFDILKEFDYPFLMKPDNGQGGNGIEMISCEADLDRFMRRYRYGDAYLAQEYVATSKGKSLRVTLIGGKARYCFSFVADPNSTEFRSNQHMGGSFAEVKNVDSAVIDMAEKIGTLFDLPLIGIDFLYTDHGYTVIEINSFPGLLSVECTTEAFNFVLGDIMGKV